MINRDQPIEKLAEEILKAYGQELAKSRQRYYAAVESETEPDPPFFVQPPRKQISGRRKIRLKRFVILVAVLTLLMGLTIVSSEGLRAQMFNFFQEDHQGHTDLSYIGGTSSEDSDLPSYELRYIPEGYEVVEENSSILTNEITLMNEEKDYFTLYISSTESYNASVDNDTLVREEIRINAYQAYLFHDKDSCMIIWQVGDYVLELITTLSPEESQEIARNIVFKSE